MLPEAKNVLIPSGRVHQSKKGSRAGGWFVFSESQLGELRLDLIPLRNADLRPIQTVLQLISRHASLGAKISNGYGVIQTGVSEVDLSWTNALRNPSSQGSRDELPDLRDFFFARFCFKEPDEANWWHKIEGIKQAIQGKLANGSSPPPMRSAEHELSQMYQKGVLPVAPAIRNWLRYHWQHGLSSEEEHFVFGEARAVCPACFKPGFKASGKNLSNCPHCRKIFTTGSEIPTTASKLFVSYAYRLSQDLWEFRVWGWLPCKGRLSNRDQFLEELERNLQDETIWQFVFNSQVKPVLQGWHSLKCSNNDGYSYLHKLLT